MCLLLGEAGSPTQELGGSTQGARQMPPTAPFGLLATPWVPEKDEGPLCQEPSWPSQGAVPSGERSDKRSHESACRHFQGGLQKAHRLPQGLALCWEWTSTRAFDFGQIRLHSHRWRGQSPGLQAAVLHGGEAFPGSPGPVPRHPLMLAATAPAHVLRPRAVVRLFCFLLFCLKLRLVLFFCWTVLNRAGCGVNLLDCSTNGSGVVSSYEYYLSLWNNNDKEVVHYFVINAL